MNNSKNDHDLSIDPNNDLQDFENKKEMTVKKSEHKSKKSSPEMIQGETIDPKTPTETVVGSKDPKLEAAKKHRSASTHISDPSKQLFTSVLETSTLKKFLSSKS